MDDAPKTMEGTRTMLHAAVRQGLRFAARTFQEPQPDGVTAVGAAIVLASAAYAMGIARALGEK